MQFLFLLNEACELKNVYAENAFNLYNYLSCNNLFRVDQNRIVETVLK